MLKDDDELSAFEFHCLVANKFRVQISASTLHRFLRLKLSRVTVRASTGPMISDTNKIKRVELPHIALLHMLLQLHQQ